MVSHTGELTPPSFPPSRRQPLRCQRQHEGVPANARTGFVVALECVFDGLLNCDTILSVSFLFPVRRTLIERAAAANVPDTTSYR